MLFCFLSSAGRGNGFEAERIWERIRSNWRLPDWPKRNSAKRKERALSIRFFHRSHNTVHFGGVFALKQWIISSLKHDTVPRVNNLYCFYAKNPPKRVALWDRENSQFDQKIPRFRVCN